ncbi:MAG: hypothetical protein AAF126_15920 [Chloroflexota bacterium]
MNDKHKVVIASSNMIHITNTDIHAIKDNDSPRWRIYSGDVWYDSADNDAIAMAKLQDILEGMTNE